MCTLQSAKREDDEGKRELPAVFVRDPDDADVCNVRMVEQVALKLGRSDLEAAYLDELLNAVDDKHFLLLVYYDFVSRPDPPVV